MGDPPVAALAAAHWARWERAIRRRDPIALGALERLQAEIDSGIISKHHDWEIKYEPQGNHYPAGQPVRVSPREREILLLLSLGHTERSAAEQLDIGLATVVTHVRRVVRKLGARNRTHAVAIAINRGVIE